MVGAVIQYAQGHKYLTLVYQIDLGITRLLWVGKERTVESFQGFFTVIGEEIASKIVFVCSDMWEPYLRVIREKCSEALHILESFSHRGENEQGTGRNPSGRIAPHGERGRRARAKEVALAAAQTRRESEEGTALPVARSAPLQPEDR